MSGLAPNSTPKPDESRLSLSFSQVQLPQHVVEVATVADGMNALLLSAVNGALVRSDARANPITSLELAMKLRGREFFLEGAEKDLRGLKEILADSLSISEASEPQAWAQLGEWVSDMKDLAYAVFEHALPTGRGFGLLTNSRRGLQFHTDEGLFVGLVAYRGPGTEFIANRDVVGGRNGKVYQREGASFFQAQNNEILLSRGRLMIPGFTDGLVHRAPSAPGPERLIFFAYGLPDSSKLQRPDAPSIIT